MPGCRHLQGLGAALLVMAAKLSVSLHADGSSSSGGGGCDSGVLSGDQLLNWWTLSSSEGGGVQGNLSMSHGWCSAVAPSPLPVRAMPPACSDEIQSVVRPQKAAPAKHAPLKKNPLKNLGVMLKLNPYAKVRQLALVIPASGRSSGALSRVCAWCIITCHVPDVGGMNCSP